MPTSGASDENPNVGVAMGLVAGAGAATALGAAVVFVPSWVQYANRTTLAAALGLSAGVRLICRNLSKICDCLCERWLQRQRRLRICDALLFQRRCFHGCEWKEC
jgi:hypothetical protein